MSDDRGVQQEMSDDRIHGSGIIICRSSKSGTEFLVLKSRWGRHWSIPKGHLSGGGEAVATIDDYHLSDNGHIIATAYRETEEETGIEAGQIDLVEGLDTVITTTLKRPTKNCPRGIKNTRVFLGVVKRDTEVVLSCEHDSFQWVKLVVAMRMLGEPYQSTVCLADKLIREYTK